MAMEENKDLIRRFVDKVFNQHELSGIEDFLAGNYVNHESWDPHCERIVRGAEGFRKLTKTYLAAFPDQKTTIDDMIAEGDKVVTRWTTQGTHTGEFMGIKPTHKQVSISGVCIDRIVGGKMVECWTTFDQAGLLTQLNVLPQEYKEAA